MHAYLATLARDAGCPTAHVGGVADHVHLLVDLGRSLAAANLVRDLKKESSKFAKTLSPDLRAFAWQNGYGVFSVSHSHVLSVRTYIAGQEEHHRRTSYQDEFRRLCERNGVEIDEAHAWL